MSLKVFHIVFIFVSIVLTLWFGIWCVQNFRNTGDSGNLWLGIGSFITTVALAFYFRWILKKLKKESNL